MSGYQELEVFQRAMALLRPAHETVRRFSDYEKCGLANQIRRACTSIPANIAEGYARRRSAREMCRYLEIALGSANELEVHLQIAGEPQYAAPGELKGLIDECRIIGRQLNRLIAYWHSIESQRPVTSD